MFLLRLLFVVVPIILVISYAMFIFTKDPGYLRFAYKLLKLVGFLLVIFALLYVLERFVLTGAAILI